MKSTIAVFVVFFIITDKNLQGLQLKYSKKCSHNKNATKPNSITLPGNRTLLVLEDQLSSTTNTRITGPTVIRKKINCICKFPACKCCYNYDPENWFVKIFLKHSRLTPTNYFVKTLNSTTEVFKYLKELKKLRNSLRKEEKAESNLFYKLNPMKKTQWRNKRLCGHPPLINLAIKKRKTKNILFGNQFNFTCTCLDCKLQTLEGNSEVFFRCVQCGPIYLNKTTEEINFSKLLLQRKNKLKVCVKFLQIN